MQCINNDWSQKRTRFLFSIFFWEHLSKTSTAKYLILLNIYVIFENSSSRFGDTSLQEKINGDNYSILNFYLEQFKDKFPDAGKLKDVLRILVNRRNACLMKPCHLFSLQFSSHPPPSI